MHSMLCAVTPCLHWLLVPTYLVAAVLATEREI